MKGYHGKWLTNDCYVFTYNNEENQKKVYVSTFGDRGDGISYFNIFPTLQGEWFNKNNGETKTYLKEIAVQLTLKIKNKTQYFDADETKQNGTIALTLSKDEEAQYIIALDENCILNEDNLLDKNGTIQIYNLQNDSSVTLYCGTYKEDKKETEIELCLTIYLNNGTGYLEESDNRNYKILTIKDGVVVDCYSD